MLLGECRGSMGVWSNAQIGSGAIFPPGQMFIFGGTILVTNLTGHLDDTILRWLFKSYIQDVIPFLLPVLVCLHELPRAVPCVGHHTDGGAAALAHLVDVGLELDAETDARQTEVRPATQESFTQRDIACDVENGIGRKVVELKVVEVEKSLKKGWIRPSSW